MDYEKCVFPFLCTLTSLLANALSPKGLPHHFALQFQNFLADMSRDTFCWRGEDVLTIWPTAGSSTVTISLAWPSLNHLCRNFRNIEGVIR